MGAVDADARQRVLGDELRADPDEGRRLFRGRSLPVPAALELDVLDVLVGDARRVVEAARVRQVDPEANLHL